MIKDFLIINCTGKNDKIGLKINNNFFIHDFQTKIKNNEILVSTILNFTNKHKANINKDFTVLVNNGPGSFSTIRVALAVAKGISISKSINLFGYNTFIWSCAKLIEKKYPIYCIIKFREKKLIKNSNELSNIIKNAKKNNRNHKKNPATKTLQDHGFLIDPGGIRAMGLRLL